MNSELKIIFLNAFYLKLKIKARGFKRYFQIGHYLLYILRQNI